MTDTAVITPETLPRPPGDLWVFGYGSLMWRPDLPLVESAPARIFGYHRALCLLSINYRGTQARPGLVCGLKRGGACRGMALRVAEKDAPAALGALWKREMVTNAYRPTWLSGHLVDGRRQKLLAFVSDPAHDQYAGGLDDDAVVRLVLQGRGQVGHCLEYLENTLDHLDEMGIHDRNLARIVDKARRTKQRGVRSK